MSATPSVLPHPAPHRGRIAAWSLAACLLLAPVAWFVQLNFSYGIWSHACYPASDPILAPSDAGTIRLLTLGATVLALLAGIAGGLVSLRHWRATKTEASGEGAKAIEVGEGRTRFLSIWAAVGSAVFALAILFGLVALAGLPSCAFP